MNGYPITAWFTLLAFAAMIGAGGQGARVIVGIKKLNDAASTSDGGSVTDMLVASKLFVSLAIGAIAGAIAAATTLVPGASLTGQHIAGIAAAGYAGADFIEGFMTRANAAPGAPAGQEAVGTGQSTPSSDDAVG